MDMLKYERFEDWSSLLMQMKKDTRVLIDVIRVKPNESTVSMNVIFQVIGDSLVHSCIVADDMPSVRIVPEGFFLAIPTEKIQNDAVNDYYHALDLFDAKVKEEYKKAEDIIKAMGYNNIIMGLVQ